MVVQAALTQPGRRNKNTLPNTHDPKNPENAKAPTMYAPGCLVVEAAMHQAIG